MGSALIVSLAQVIHAPLSADSDVRVKVTYTTKESKALQWLDPQYVRLFLFLVVKLSRHAWTRLWHAVDRRRESNTRICSASVSPSTRARWSPSKVRTPSPARSCQHRAYGPLTVRQTHPLSRSYVSRALPCDRSMHVLVLVFKDVQGPCCVRVTRAHVRHPDRPIAESLSEPRRPRQGARYVRVRSGASVLSHRCM